ncbi:MAG TPA: hypothetical protein VFR28_03400 [Allosphingosinicella sp.]|jgi:hypothetical protein|nr:hypothetical protein [Allosphingosinicella sp.]
MRTSLSLLLLALAAAEPAGAALPPQYQRAAEFRAVAADARIAGAFGSTPIERIEYVRPDLYRVSAGRCRLDVRIVDLPTPADVSGGRRFAVRAGQKTCTR